MNLTKLFALSFVALSLQACCGGGDKKEPSRWENTGKAGSPAAPAKPTTAPAKPEPAKPEPAKPEPAKAEPKPVEAGALNKFFPADDTDGAKRVFKGDKPAYAEAEFTTKDKKKLTLTITDLAGKPDERAKLSGGSEKVSGYPYRAPGKNKCQILVADRFQVDAMSIDLDEATRKTWLGKFNLSGLAALK